MSLVIAQSSSQTTRASQALHSVSVGSWHHATSSFFDSVFFSLLLVPAESGAAFISQIADGEEVIDDTVPAKLRVLPFSSWAMGGEWEVSLPKSEDVEGVAMGNGWVAVATSKQVGFVSVSRSPAFLLSLFFFFLLSSSSPLPFRHNVSLCFFVFQCSTLVAIVADHFIFLYLPIDLLISPLSPQCIRLFDCGGSQGLPFRFPGRFLCMTGHGPLLALIYHQVCASPAPLTFPVLFPLIASLPALLLS